MSEINCATCLRAVKTDEDYFNDVDANGDKIHGNCLVTDEELQNPREILLKSKCKINGSYIKNEVK